MAVSFNIEGQSYSFPDWASESTSKQMVDILTEIAKANGVSGKALAELRKSNEDMLKATQKANKKEEKSNEEQLEAIEDQKKAIDKGFKDNNKTIKEEQGKTRADNAKGRGFLDSAGAGIVKFGRQLESDGEELLGFVGKLGDVALGVGTALTGIVAGGLAFVANKALGVGDELNKLTKVGVGFNSTLGGLDTSATQGIARLGALGLGFEGAAQLIAANSRVVATAGLKRFEDTMKFAADTSEELGMSFEDSMGTFGEALQRRQRLLNVGSVDQGRLNKQIQTTTRFQTAYATALGESTEEIQAFVDGLIANNGMLTASFLRFGDTVRSDLVAGVEVFASGLAALGGQGGQALAEAFTEQATMGAIGLSDAAIGMVQALPRLAGPMNEFRDAVQAGTLTQSQADEMVQGLVKDLGNVSKEEKDRIFMLARIGDESAKQMAQAITQFEQSESKMAEVNKMLGTGFDMDTVQKGTNNFNKIVAQATSGFSSAFYSLFADPEITKALEDGLKEIMSIFGFATDDMSGGAQGMADMGKDLAKKVLPALKSGIEVVVRMFEKLSDYLSKFQSEEGFDFGELFKDVVGKIKGALIDGLMSGIKYLIGAIFIYSASKQALSFLGGLVKKGGSKLVSSIMGGGGSTVASAAGGVGSQGSTAAKMLTGASKNADGMTSAMTKGGKSGGFLQSIANAVKKFGDNKVVKGAASMVMMGAAVALLAVGLKQFNEVDFASMGKGLLAMGGMIGLSKLLEKSSTSMVKGAVGVLALSTAIVPLAFGLNLMKDVGFKTIGVLATAIAALAVAAGVIGMPPIVGFVMAGALAIGVLGAALIPFAVAAMLAAKAFDMFVPNIVMMSMVDGKNLIMVGAGLAAIGAGLAVMTGGSLIAGLMEGIGKLFGAKSPMEKVIDFAKGLQGVDVTSIFLLGEGFKGLAESKNVIDMFDNMDDYSAGVMKFAVSIDSLTAALARLEAGVPKETTFFDKIKDVATQVGDFLTGGKVSEGINTVKAGNQAGMPTAPTQINQANIPDTAAGYGMGDDEIDALVGTPPTADGTAPDRPDTPENDTAALLAELVRLQAENNKLSKRQISATEDIDF